MTQIVIQCDTYGKIEIETQTADLKAISDTYSKIRDDSTEGYSTFSNGVVYDQLGERSHIISYNGKVWDVARWPDLDHADALVRATNALGLMVYSPYLH